MDGVRRLAEQVGVGDGIGPRAPERDVVRLVPDLPRVHAERRVPERGDAGEGGVGTEIVRRALVGGTARLAVPARCRADDRDDRHAARERALHDPVGAGPVVDPGPELDAAPGQRRPQPLRARRGHEVEVGLDVCGRLAPDELEAVGESGARARHRESARCGGGGRRRRHGRGGRRPGGVGARGAVAPAAAGGEGDQQREAGDGPEGAHGADSLAEARPAPAAAPATGPGRLPEGPWCCLL